MEPPSQISEPRFEACASTASLFLYAEGSVISCLHHDTLALERRFENHQDDILFISVDNVSERGAGRLVVSYDVGQTAIVWDLFTGTEIARFASFEPLRVASWMRNGNVAFGNGKGDVVLFEPSTSEHISARTIFDPITALAPAMDCRTYAIGYQNGSILIATLHPTFTILHTLTTSRGPSPIVTLAWHASSSKQKSDMLATQSTNGDLRVWSVAKPPGKETPRVIRILKRTDSTSAEPKFIAWSKNGRIVQYLDGETYAWDVRTKHVTYEPIPTIENPRGIASYGPTATLFTLGPQHTVQQYDLDNPAMVANVQHLPESALAMAVEEARKRPMSPRTLQDPPEIRESGSMFATGRKTPFDPNGVESVRQQRAELASPVSSRSRTNSVNSRASSSRYQTTPFSPPSRSGQSGTTFSLTSASGRDTPQASHAYASSVSMSSVKSSRAGSRLRNEVQMSPADRHVDLFPFTRARLNDVPYRQHRPLDETHLTHDDLRQQMLSMVFGWDGDIDSLIKDELNQHPHGSQSAILLSQWLGESDRDQMTSMLGSGPATVSDWMLLAFSQMNGQRQANKVGQAFVQKLLEIGDVHTAATILLGLGDQNDAIEVYVSQSHFMEAILMTCLLTPTDWQRQSYLVRRWGEHVVSHSQQQLAIRCFMCTGAEPSDPWASPSAQQTSSFEEVAMGRSPMTSPEPAYSKPASLLPPNAQPNPPAGNRMPAKAPSLKLITSFDNEPSQKLRFPGLKTDDQTPTNAPGITPIAESAVIDSALSPGGLGSYRLNNLQSLNQAMGSRTGTPGFNRQRLPSIGETPVDVHPPTFSSHSLHKSEDFTSMSEGEDHRRSQSQDDQANGSLSLLPSARYDPNQELKPSPQTAIQTSSDKFASIKGLPSPAPGLLEALRESSDSRNGSRDRKPDGLQINLLQAEPSVPVGQETPAVLASVRSPASTLNSLNSGKSPSVSGRSIDQYISSLDQANFHAKKQRPRRNTEDSASYGGYKQHSRQTSQDTRGRHENHYIQPAKRSPSSPVSITPEELAKYPPASTENDAHKPTKRHASKTRSASRVRKGGSRNSSRRRNRSSSRNAASRIGNDRGRSIDREGSSDGSPSSPLPMSPVDDALRLVTSDRERRQRSSSRRPDKSASMRRDPSPEPRNFREDSRSGQGTESDMTSEQELDNSYTSGVGHEIQILNGDFQETSDISTEEALDVPSANLPFIRLAEQRRKELAAAELEARRLSLARNPSAPNIPFPGDPQAARGTLDSPMFFGNSFIQRTPSRNLVSPGKESPSSSSDSGSSRSGVPLGLPATPRAMRNSKYNNGYEEESAPAVPNVPDNTILSAARYQGEAERIPRSMSVPVPESQYTPPIPTDLPTHPRFNPNLPRSRSTSRSRNMGPRRESREMGSPGGYYTSSPMTVSIEETIENALAMQRRQMEPQQNPPILPELQHLNAPPPPPPPAPLSTAGSARESSGTIDIAIDNENLGRLLPRAMTAGPTSSFETRPVIERRRTSLDHRRGRSINESLTSKLRNFTRMRSNSRGPEQWLPTHETEMPYESVQMVESRI
ncbi:hypothetical protein MW887_002125 [Aspergillus wentii]|nr:hypothetical protein MW887_002125 [Aspergillus wentii]